MASWTSTLRRLLHLCKSHMYKVLILSVFCLIALQYGLGTSFYGTKPYLSVTFLYNSGKELVTTPPFDMEPVPLINILAQNRTSWPTFFSGDNLDTSSNITRLMTNSTQIVELPLCPLVPPKLVGRLKVWTDAPSWEKLEELYPYLEDGGRCRPNECRSKHRVAIVIPYRNRDYHLRLFIYNMHPILRRQQLDYGIYVVEEAGDMTFNRAMLMNIGFVEALKLYNYQCFIFHDVDLLPEDDRNLYSCPEQPRHMSVAVDNLGYKLPYADIFGGVSALTKEQMERVNGFSNEFWGWGGEDDDMSNRIRHYGYKISRYQPSIARYKMMKHTKDKPNPDRYNKLYKGKLRYKTDGINSLNYTRTNVLLKRLYTWIEVELKRPQR